MFVTSGALGVVGVCFMWNVCDGECKHLNLCKTATLGIVTSHVHINSLLKFKQDTLHTTVLYIKKNDMYKTLYVKTLYTGTM